MTTQTLQIRRRTNGTIDVDHYRRQADGLRNQYSVNMMRGANATIWTLAAGVVLMLAVAAFAPRNIMTAEVASGSGEVTIAARTR